MKERKAMAVILTVSFFIMTVNYEMPRLLSLRAPKGRGNPAIYRGLLRRPARGGAPRNDKKLVS